jgi:hypothetical protein
VIRSAHRGWLVVVLFHVPLMVLARRTQTSLGTVVRPRHRQSSATPPRKVLSFVWHADSDCDALVFVPASPRVTDWLEETSQPLEGRGVAD